MFRKRKKNSHVDYTILTEIDYCTETEQIQIQTQIHYEVLLRIS